jgi:hypothetical protein
LMSAAGELNSKVTDVTGGSLAPMRDVGPDLPELEILDPAPWSEGGPPERYGRLRHCRRRLRTPGCGRWRRAAWIRLPRRSSAG